MNIMSLIDGFRRLDRMSVEELCRRTGISTATYNRRLRRPEDLTVKEFAAFKSALHLRGERLDEVFRVLSK